MQYSERQQFEPVTRAIAAVSVLYAIFACILIATIPRNVPIRTIPDWIAIPSQLLAVAASLIVILRRRNSGDRSAVMWSLICAFSVMSAVATYMWNEFRAFGNDRSLSFADVCYFVDYALVTAAYGAGFRYFGGSFRSRRTWLDALTILVALLATFWATILGPFSPPGQSQPMGLVFGGSYLTSIALLVTAASLLFTKLPAPRLRPIEILLIAAGLIDVIWELAWLANWVRHMSFIGLYYNYGDVLCFTLVACAAAVKPRAPQPQAMSDKSTRHTFFPILSALLATALIGVFLASTRTTDAWILVGLVILTALLLVVRQAAVSRDLDALNGALAARAADARLSELLRQSADAFLIVDARQAITFASPTTEAILRISPDQLAGTSAQELLGPSHRVAMGVFLRQLASAPIAPEPLELTFGSRAGSLRTFRISGTNLLKNPSIAGLGLTITDISALRELQREVLEVANKERVRLAGDMHEGLGQQLVGIKMMLQGAAKTPDPDPNQQQRYMDAIIKHVTDAIDGMRDLACGLSPIHVGGGSLRGALQRLGSEAGGERVVRVGVDPGFDDRAVDDFPADYLFRIAQEAVNNADRHSGCTETIVSLKILEEFLVLSIRDNGRGCDFQPQDSPGIGLRLMEYRARVIGGSFSIGRGPQSGTLVQARIPLRYVLENTSPEIASYGSTKPPP